MIPTLSNTATVHSALTDSAGNTECATSNPKFCPGLQQQLLCVCSHSQNQNALLRQLPPFHIVTLTPHNHTVLVPFVLAPPALTICNAPKLSDALTSPTHDQPYIARLRLSCRSQQQPGKSDFVQITDSCRIGQTMSQQPKAGEMNMPAKGKCTFCVGIMPLEAEGRLSQLAIAASLPAADTNRTATVLLGCM